ncbi:MAG: class I SAM-dependent methyltransferase [Bacteroidetes bacterium]|nr:MAG: class I SAM-dependent methyltransferase [Bacteroidota bacterium]
MTITETASRNKFGTSFDKYALEYDKWFDKHENQYQSEILALREAIPKDKIGIEIGVGTGRFAQPLNITSGIEPSANMIQLAEQRGIKVFRAVAENLPIENDSYDFALMVTTVCFLNNIPKAFSEIHRILKPNGEIIIGLIDKNSELGKKYRQQKNTNKFYKTAHFHSTSEITELLSNSGFGKFSFWQTLTPENGNIIEQPQSGFGKGSFVVIKSIKTLKT